MTGLLRIERAYINQNNLGPWEEISQDEFLRRTEWAGYFKNGTALIALHDLGEIRTPFAYFRLHVNSPRHVSGERPALSVALSNQKGEEG